jgi:hypothetical protein
MISAMALMPIPPMPRMCTGPVFRGICMRRFFPSFPRA